MMDLTPIEMLLMQYATGTLSPYESLVVVAHLSLNPKAREKVSQYEAVGGNAIKDVPPAQLQSGCLEKVLEKIDACDKTAKACPDKKKREMPQDLGIPASVYALLCGACLEDPRCWSKFSTGVSAIDLKVCSSEPVHRRLCLMRLDPRQSTPQHAHAGREITLVLEGGFTDVSGHYDQGDILIINDPRYTHSPKADSSGCLCLTLTEAPLRFRNPLERFLHAFLR